MTTDQFEVLNANLQPNIHLTKKLNKLLETRLDNDKDMIASLKSLSTFSSGNNLQNRRNLRSNIERKNLSINYEFVNAFADVDSQIKSLYTSISEMSDCCNDMKKRLCESKSQTQSLISLTTGLKNERETLKMKSKMVNVFLEKFQLHADQVKVLHSNSNSLDPTFFEVLIRLKEIHCDCKILLRTNQQTAGLEIMESMALYLETAYEKLYRWCQNECRQFTCECPPISQQFCSAINALRDRPVLFRYSLDEYGSARRTAIVRGFIDALTRGGPGSRPIELHSHDPLRYIGDMLAWLHQSLAGESEYLYAVCKLCPTPSIETQSICQEVLSHVSEGLCRPLKVRCEQVLLSEPGAVELYKLSNLIHFYCTAISEVKKCKTSSLLSTMDDLRILAVKMFYNSLHCHSTMQLEKVEYPPNNLGPTVAMTKTLSLLKDILSSQDNSLTADDSRKEQIQSILKCIVEPLVQTTSLSGCQLSRDCSADTATYMINSLHMISSCLALFAFTGPQLQSLDMQIQAHVDTMVIEQTSSVLNQAGLGSIYNLIEQHNIAAKDIPLCTVQGMDAIAIKTAMNNFDVFLSSPDLGEISQCLLLLSSKLRDEIKQKSYVQVYEVYAMIYASVMKPTSGYNDCTLVSRSPEQVKNLLSLY